MGHAVGMGGTEAEALDAWRAFNYERIYLRPAARAEAVKVIRLLRQLTEWFIEHPEAGGRHGRHAAPGSPEAVTAAVRFVSGMTDRYALGLAVERLGWDPADLPRGV